MSISLTWLNRPLVFWSQFVACIQKMLLMHPKKSFKHVFVLNFDTSHTLFAENKSQPRKEILDQKVVIKSKQLTNKMDKIPAHHHEDRAY